VMSLLPETSTRTLSNGDLQTEDVRGSMLSGFASALNPMVCNEGSVNASSVIDVTFARSADNRPLVHDWSVLEQRYSGSDHEYITYSVFKSAPCRSSAEVARPGGWLVKKLSPAAITEHRDRVSAPPTLPRYSSTEEHVWSVSRNI